MATKMLRVSEVMELVGIRSRTTLHAWERRENFPKRRRLSAGVVAWDSREVERWLASRPKGAKSR